MKGIIVNSIGVLSDAVHNDVSKWNKETNQQIVLKYFKDSNRLFYWLEIISELVVRNICNELQTPIGWVDLSNTWFCFLIVTYSNVQGRFKNCYIQ